MIADKPSGKVSKRKKNDIWARGKEKRTKYKDE